MPGYVYFFKHNNISGVKIGCTTKNDVRNRFSAFNTSSPYGAEILGTIYTHKPFVLEKTIHNEMAPFKMNGEFFDITTTQVDFLIGKYGNESKNLKHTLHKVESVYNGQPDDEKASFLSYMDSCIKKFKNPPLNSSDEIFSQIKTTVLDCFEPATEETYNRRISATEIMEEIFHNDKKIKIRKLGITLKALGFQKQSARIDGKVKQVYLLLDKR